VCSGAGKAAPLSHHTPLGFLHEGNCFAESKHATAKIYIPVEAFISFLPLIQAESV
jgi:hypothetical protein